MKKITTVLLVSIGLALSSQVAFASQSTTQPENVHYVSGGGNYFSAGANPTIEEETDGDVFLVGSSVVVNKEVESDLFAAGGNLSVGKDVSGDARVAGGNVTVSSTVGGDLNAAGGTVTLTDDGMVMGEADIAGGQVSVQGMIGGGAKIIGGNIVINADIEGDVEVRAQEKIEFGPRAKISGKVKVWSPDAPQVNEEAKPGLAIEYTQTPRNQSAGAMVGIGIGVLVMIGLSLFLINFIIYKLAGSKALMAYSGSLYDSFWANLGLGFAVLVGGPILSLILLVTVVGSLLGLVTLVTYGVVMLYAWLLTPMFLGAFLMSKIKKTSEMSVSALSILLGVAVFVVVWMIPFVGGLITLVLMLVSLGQILRQKRMFLKKINQQGSIS